MRSVVSVSLPPDLAAELDRLARETGRTKSDILKESFGTYLWEMKGWSDSCGPIAVIREAAKSEEEAWEFF